MTRPWASFSGSRTSASCVRVTVGLLHSHPRPPTAQRGERGARSAPFTNDVAGAAPGPLLGDRRARVARGGAARLHEGEPQRERAEGPEDTGGAPVAGAAEAPQRAQEARRRQALRRSPQEP